MTTLYIKDVMRQTEVFSAKASVSKAIAVMAEKQLPCVVVIDENEHPIGIVSEATIVLASAQKKKIHSLKIEQIHCSKLSLVDCNTSIYDAISSAHESHSPILVAVSEDGKVVGITTMTELLRGAVVEVEQRNRVLKESIQSHSNELINTKAALKKLTMIDRVTDVGNERALSDSIGRYHANAQRHGTPFSLAKVSINHFKDYLLRYGQAAGDVILREVAGLLKDKIRRGDNIFRLGEDSFVLLLSFSSSEGAIILGQRLVTAVSALELVHEDTNSGFVSVSIGTASWNTEERAQTWKEVLEQASTALEFAKKQTGVQVADATQLSVLNAISTYSENIPSQAS